MCYLWQENTKYFLHLIVFLFVKLYFTNMDSSLQEIPEKCGVCQELTQKAGDWAWWQKLKDLIHKLKKT